MPETEAPWRDPANVLPAFDRKLQLAVLKALGIEGHKVHRIEITFDALEAVSVKVYEYATAGQVDDFVRVLTLGDWHDA